MYTRVLSRATGDSHLRSSCVRRELRQESRRRRPRATRRVIIVYSSLLRHAFAVPEFCLCRVTMATPCDRSGAYSTEKYQTVLVSFRDGRRARLEEKGGTKEGGIRYAETLCVLLQRGSDDVRRRERLRRD